MAAQSKVRRQIRSFVFVWTFITILMGACTFAAIYAAYGTLNTSEMNPGMRNVAIPLNTQSSGAPVVIVPTNTPLPTRQLNTAVPSETPTTEAQAEPTEENIEGGGAAAAAASPTPTLLPVDVDQFEAGIQVQVSYDNMQLWMDLVHDQLQLPWVKLQVRWEEVEPEQGEYNWPPVDVFLEAAARDNLNVLISVVTAPEWAREEGANVAQHGPPADPQVYADFVAEILRRHPGKVHAVEVWNEMNLDREWTSVNGIRAGDYVELLRVSYETIKSIDPGVIVVSGALSPTGVDNGTTVRDDEVFMDELISAGMLNYTDCVGAHHNGINVDPQYAFNQVPPEPNANFRGPFDNPHRSWSFRSTLQTYALQIENAGGDQKLCVTEFGWAVSEDIGGFPPGFEFAQDNTLEEQRDFTIRALDSMREWGTVRLAFLWNLNYGPQAGWDPNNDNVPYSIIGPNTTFRPVFDALKEWQAEYRASQNS